MIYKVGGAVRDLLLGREPKDVDYVVVGETVEEFLRQWPEARQIGKSFPVFQVTLADGEVMEFAFARRERRTGPRHQDFAVEADSSVTLEEDLGRRDLTINAMALPFAYCPKTALERQVIDPFGGLFDLRARVLRHVGPAFSEDALRVYRLARFLATLEGFSVAPETVAMVSGMDKGDQYSLSAERVAEETRKAMRGVRPELYFRMLLDTFNLEPWFPDLMRLVGVPAGPPGHHDEVDAFAHTMMVLECACATPIDGSVVGDFDVEIMRWAVLTHDLGKGITPREEWPRHILHEQNGVHLVERFYDRLKMPTDFKEAAVVACRDHLRVHNFLEMKKGKMVDLIRRADRTKLKAEGLAAVALCDAMGRIAKNKSMEGPKALLACADACRDESGHPIPDSLEGEAIGLHIRNRKGTATRRKLKELGYIGQHRANAKGN